MNGGKPCNKKSTIHSFEQLKRVAERTAHKKRMKNKRGKLQRMRKRKWENNNDRKK